MNSIAIMINLDEIFFNENNVYEYSFWSTDKNYIDTVVGRMLLELTYAGKQLNKKLLLKSNRFVIKNNNKTMFQYVDVIKDPYYMFHYTDITSKNDEFVEKYLFENFEIKGTHITGALKI